MIPALLAALLLQPILGTPGHPSYCPKRARSSAAVQRFLKAHGVKPDSLGRYHVPKDSTVEHEVPVCDCGADDPSNMRLIASAEATRGDVREKQLCAALARQMKPAKVAK